MKLLERLTNLFHKREARADTFTPMNRRQRRAAGLRAPVGLLPEGVESPQETQVPRYVMRHRDAMAVMPSWRPRRWRKERARITRIIKARGLV
jgi:hypothetical protein